MCYGLAPAGKKGPCGCSIAPLCSGVGRRIWRKRQNSWVGWDKGSLTEQQRKWTVTNRILIRRIYKTREYTEQLSQPAAQCAPEQWLTSRLASSPTQNQTWHLLILYTLFVWPGWVSCPSCVHSWLLVKINSVPGEPRTGGYLSSYQAHPCKHALIFSVGYAGRLGPQFLTVNFRLQSERQVLLHAFQLLYYFPVSTGIYECLPFPDLVNIPHCLLENQDCLLVSLFLSNE